MRRSEFSWRSNELTGASTMIVNFADYGIGAPPDKHRAPYHAQHQELASLRREYFSRKTPLQA